jgi:hypothetical protein
MPQIVSVKKQQLLAMANAGQITAGWIYFANDTQETFLAVTGEPNVALFPMSSLILTGQYELAGAPGPQGETGPQGPAGPPTPLAQQIALTIALG